MNYLALAQGSKKKRWPRRSFNGSMTVLNAERRWCSSQPLGQTSRPSFFRNRIFLHCLQFSIITPSTRYIIIYPINFTSGEASLQDKVSVYLKAAKARSEPPLHVVVWRWLMHIWAKRVWNIFHSLLFSGFMHMKWITISEFKMRKRGTNRMAALSAFAAENGPCRCLYN